MKIQRTNEATLYEIYDFGLCKLLVSSNQYSYLVAALHFSQQLSLSLFTNQAMV